MRSDPAIAACIGSLGGKPATARKSAAHFARDRKRCDECVEHSGTS